MPGAMIELPGGWFLMGSEERPDERPVRRVRVDPFALAPLQVTNEEYARFAPPPLLKRMVAAGRLGKKTGRGFYNYDG